MRMLVKVILIMATIFLKLKETNASLTATAYTQEAIDSCPQEDPIHQREILSEIICCLMFQSLKNCRGICYNSSTKMCRFNNLELNAVTKVPSLGFIMYWRPADKKIYYVYGTPPSTYSTAMWTCGHHRHYLGYPKNPIENFNLIEHNKKIVPSQYFWTSFTDADHENIFVNPYTGRMITYANWDEDEPNGGTGQNCVAINSEEGKWYDKNQSPDKNCNDFYNFTCQFYDN